MDNKRAFALGAIVSAILVITILASAIFVLQMGNTTRQPSQTVTPPLQKFRVSGSTTFATNEFFFLAADAANEKGIYASNGLDPQFEYAPLSLSAIPQVQFKEQIASGISIGVSRTPDFLLIARLDGVPVKIVAAYLGKPNGYILVEGDGPIKTPKDLDGKKIGVNVLGGVQNELAVIFSNKFEINTEVVQLGNLSAEVAALKLGRVHAVASSDTAALRLVNSGELRILVDYHDLRPAETASLAIWATDDIIQQDPELVKKFVKAWLEAVKYLKENPTYASDDYAKKTGASKEFADKVVSAIEWTPEGRGSGKDLVAAVRNVVQNMKDRGVFPADANLNVEDAVDVRFLP